MKFSDVMNMCQGNSQHNTPEWDINDNHIPKVSLSNNLIGFFSPTILSAFLIQQFYRLF